MTRAGAEMMNVGRRGRDLAREHRLRLAGRIRDDGIVVLDRIAAAAARGEHDGDHTHHDASEHPPNIVRAVTGVNPICHAQRCLT
jgi:hypothetical protein